MAATTYPGRVVAELLDLTERRLQQLAAEGVIPRTERGRYELAPAVRGYVRHLRDRSAGASAVDGLGDARRRLLGRQ